MELHGSLSRLVSRFFPDPRAFLDLMTPWQALIVGEAALSHVLRDPTLCRSTFEIAVANHRYQPFVDNMLRLLASDSLISSHGEKPVPEDFPFNRHISRITDVHLTSGLLVTVYESCTPTASDVICGSWTTALMNFVSAYSFGCAYPRLTLNRLALLCDTRANAMCSADHDVDRHLRNLGFRFDTRALAWPLHLPDQGSTTNHLVHGCGSDIYVCPLQGRYFGDVGSLIVYHDGLSVDLALLRHLQVAPYGRMVSWRLPSSGTCKGLCKMKGNVLPPLIVTTLSEFVDDRSTYSKIDAQSGSTASSVVLNVPRRYSF